MNEVGPSLVTSYTFKSGKEYIVKIRIAAIKGHQRNLQLTITDKYTAESWQSCYDAAYIENLTRKTGNYKHFDVFVAMLQSGLLKVKFVFIIFDQLNGIGIELQTSESIALDLLTFEDLELLRARKLERSSCTSLGNATNNRRYLILTYTVEFDRIHYPLPLEYCGLPSPTVLQTTIRKLQTELERLQSAGVDKDLRKRIEQLTIANQKLVQENRRLASGGKGLKYLLESIKSLENNVVKERTSFRMQIQKLKAENAALLSRIQQLTATSACKKSGGDSPASKRRNRAACKRNRSRSSSISSRNRTSSLSPGSSLESIRTQRSPCRNTKIHNNKTKNAKIEFENLEARIHTLQKMLKEGISLN